MLKVKNIFREKNSCQNYKIDSINVYCALNSSLSEILTVMVDLMIPNFAYIFVDEIWSQLLSGRIHIVLGDQNLAYGHRLVDRDSE